MQAFMIRRVVPICTRQSPPEAWHIEISWQTPSPGALTTRFG